MDAQLLCMHELFLGKPAITANALTNSTIPIGFE
jgi:hypothetical protein